MLGVFVGIMTVLTLSGQYTSAASQVPSNDCTVSFSGNLTSLQMSPAGTWRIISSDCIVTDQSGGITSGTFTGSFTSDVASGRVSGSWSISGTAESLVASNTGFTLSISNDKGLGQMPLVGSAYQGMLSGTGTLAMFVVGTTGQIAVS